MSIPTLSNTSTFLTWLSTTNTIIDTLNSNTLVAGVEANGAFAVGNTTDLISSLSIGGTKITANGQNLVVSVAATLNSNVTISNLATAFSVAANTLFSSPVTTINSPSLLVGSTAEFNAATSFSGTVQLTGTLTTIKTASLNTATINTATLNNATISSLTVANALTYSNTFIVNGSTTIGNTLTVSGNTTFGANVTTTGQLRTSNTLTVTGATALSNTLAVTGATTLSNTLVVSGDVTLSRMSVSNVTSAVYCDSTVRVASGFTALSTAQITGASTLSNTVAVTGATTLSNTLAVSGATTLSSTLAVTGTTTVSAGLTSASLTTGGALSVGGTATLSGGLTVTGPGPITLANTVVLGSTAVTGDAGTMRVAWQSGQTYIQSGLNAATGASSNLVFGTIGGTDEWMRIIASSKTLKVNGPIEYTSSQVMKYVSVYAGGVSTYYGIITTLVAPTAVTCDGFLHCLIDCRVQGLGLLSIEILGGPSGTLLLGGTGTNGGVTNTMVPIRKGDQYTVRSVYSDDTFGGAGTPPYLLVYWVPLGTAG